MNQRFRIDRRVEFRDTDMAGIVHFSNFFVYMEQAEHAFLRSLGLAVVQPHDGYKISWPRVNAICNYRQSIRFEEVIQIELFVSRMGTSSIQYGFEFFRDGKMIADGSLVAVCCRLEPGMKPVPESIPSEFATALLPFVLGKDVEP